jgi:hypothetical protein
MKKKQEPEKTQQQELWINKRQRAADRCTPCTLGGRKTTYYLN